MSLAAEYRFDDFTTTNYSRLLELARSWYSFEPFGSNHEGMHVLWRHDVDYSVHRARRLAEVEAGSGCRSTFFLRLHSDCYSLLERGTLDHARALSALGHWIGLHFDTAFYDDPLDNHASLARHVEQEWRLVEDLLQTSVTAISFHNPELSGALRLGNDQYCGLHNAYSATIANSHHYVSDSNGYWRYERLEDILKAHEHTRLHVLTHPEWWQETPMSPYSRLTRCAEGRARAAIDRYSEELVRADRLNVGQ